MGPNLWIWRFRQIIHFFSFITCRYLDIDFIYFIYSSAPNKYQYFNSNVPIQFLEKWISSTGCKDVCPLHVDYCFMRGLQHIWEINLTCMKSHMPKSISYAGNLICGKSISYAVMGNLQRTTVSGIINSSAGVSKGANTAFTSPISMSSMLPGCHLGFCRSSHKPTINSAPNWISQNPPHQPEISHVLKSKSYTHIQCVQRSRFYYFPAHNSTFLGMWTSEFP